MQTHVPFVSLGHPVSSTSRNAKVSLKGMLTHDHKVYGIYDGITHVSDSRGSNASIPSANLITLPFMTVLTQEDSFNSFLNSPLSMTQAVINSLPCGGKIPSRHAIENYLSKVNCSEFHDLMFEVACKAKETGGLKAGAIVNDSTEEGAPKYLTAGTVDGTEHWSSKTKGGCGHCLTRTLKDGTKEHYHRSVVLSVRCGRGNIVVDYEMLSARDPGEKDEGEITGFSHICDRLEERKIRLFDVLSGDALFANATSIRDARRALSEGVFRIKGDDRLLIREAEERFSHGGGTGISFIGQNRKGERFIVVAWYADDFHMTGVNGDLRLVRFLEIPVNKDLSPDLRTDEKGNPLREEKVIYMISTTTKIGILAIWQICHYRWDIEDCIFHQLATYYNFGHLYSHVGAEAMFALTLLAYNMRTLYLCRFRARDFVGRYSFKDFTKLIWIELHIYSVREILDGLPARRAG